MELQDSQESLSCTQGTSDEQNAENTQDMQNSLRPSRQAASVHRELRLFPCSCSSPERQQLHQLRLPTSAYEEGLSVLLLEANLQVSNTKGETLITLTKAKILPNPVRRRSCTSSM